MTAADAHEELEAAFHEALGKAWRMAVAYCASDLAGPGVPLGYPEDRAETGRLLAKVVTYAEAVADERIAGHVHDRAMGRERLAEAVDEVASCYGRPS
jgi:hypothetical protein